MFFNFYGLSGYNSNSTCMQHDLKLVGLKEMGTRLPGIRPGSFRCYYRVIGALESEQRRDGVVTMLHRRN